MRTLVTGAAGFIGSTLVDRLLAEGHAVTGVDNLSTGRLANLDQARRSEAFTLVVCDVTGPELGDVVATAAPEVVFHLAAQVDVRLSVTDPLHDARVNVLGTINVLEASRRAGSLRFVYTSSAGLYGAPARLPVTEDDVIAPLSPYAAAKASGELYLHAIAGMFGITPVSLALANVYGPRQDPRGEAGVVTIFGTALLTGRPTTIFGDGGSTRDYIYVGDVVEAFIRAAQASVTRRRLNIGTGVETSVSELHRLVAQAAGAPDRPGYAQERNGEIRASVLDNGAARTELDWKPSVELGEGVHRTIEWLRDTLLGAPGSRTAG